MDETLATLERRGFSPTLVIDVGANVGQWADRAAAAFPAARFHLIEPQAGCQPALARFRAPRFQVHPTAVTSGDVRAVRFIGGGQDRASTGAFISPTDSPSDDAAVYPATTLDALLSREIRRDDRVLLKLDVEGHETAVLQGARSLLRMAEVLLCEVNFYDAGSLGVTVFADLLGFARQQGFALDDFASLAERRRDGRLRQGDAVFIRCDSPLLADARFE